MMASPIFLSWMRVQRIVSSTASRVAYAWLSSFVRSARSFSISFVIASSVGLLHAPMVKLATGLRKGPAAMLRWLRIRADLRHASRLRPGVHALANEGRR